MPILTPNKYKWQNDGNGGRWQAMQIDLITLMA